MAWQTKNYQGAGFMEQGEAKGSAHSREEASSYPSGGPTDKDVRPEFAR
jgi:hypothetical protein